MDLVRMAIEKLVSEPVDRVIDRILDATTQGKIDPDVAARWITHAETLPPGRLLCGQCVERSLVAWSEHKQGKGGEVVGRVIKISDAFYEKIKAMADLDDKGIGETVEEVAGAALGVQAEFNRLKKECAEELGVSVAADPAWEERMLQLIPLGLSPALDRIRGVYACALDKMIPEEGAPAPVAEEAKAEV